MSRSVAAALGRGVALAFAFLLAGCGLHVNRPLEEVIEKTYEMRPDGKFSINNRDGSIWIYGAEISELKLYARKKAYRRERLEKIAVDVSAQPGSIAIETKYPPAPRWGFSDRSGTVDYVIILPWTCDIADAELINGELLVADMRGREVKARLASGRLYGQNCFTNFQAAVETGGLDLNYDWWEGESFSVEAKIANGHLRALISGNASFRLQAESANGQIFNDFLKPEQRRNEPQTKIDMLVGAEPEVELKLHAANGNIRVEATKY